MLQIMCLSIMLCLRLFFVFGLDNEEQYIFTLCAFMNQHLHQYAGKPFDRINTSVIIIIPLTTLLYVCMGSSIFYNGIPNTFNYITTCASAAVIFTIAFSIPFKTTNTMCMDFCIQQALLQLFHPYICRTRSN